MKDFTISLLLDQLDEAEEQYRMTVNSHSEDTRRVIGKFVHNNDIERINSLSTCHILTEQFKDKMEEMQKGFYLARHDILKEAKKHRKELKDQSKLECNEHLTVWEKLRNEGSVKLKKEFESRMDSLEKKVSWRIIYVTVQLYSVTM